MKTKVLVVDGHAAVRQMIGPALGNSYEIVAEASGGVEALEVLRISRPQVVMMELVLPEVCGLTVIQHLRSLNRGLRILIFSGTRNEDLVADALREGPQGFVHKTDSFSVLQSGLDMVARGGTYYSPFATTILDRRRAKSTSGWENLSVREQSVFQLVAEGCSSKEAAARLKLATKTVEHCRARVMHKLGCREVTALTRYAVRRGLVAVD